MKETFLLVECHVTQPIRDLGFEPRLLHMTWLIRPPLSPTELIPHIIGGVLDFSCKSALSFSPDMKSNPLPWSFTLPASGSLSYRFVPYGELAS